MTALDPDDRPTATGVLATLDPASRPADVLEGDPTVNLGGPGGDEATAARCPAPAPAPAPAPQADAEPVPGSIAVHDIAEPDAPAAPTPPERVARTMPDLARIPKKVLLGAAAAVVVLVIVAVLVLGGGDDGTDPVDPPAGMPPELADALAGLEEAVQP